MRSFVFILMHILFNSFPLSKLYASEKSIITSQSNFVQAQTESELFKAIREGELFKFKLLLEEEIKSTENVVNLISKCLLTSVYYNRIEFTKLLIAKKANLEARYLGLTSLHLAIVHKRHAILKLLLKNGANQMATTRRSYSVKNVEFPEGSTSLYLAHKLNSSAFDILLNFGITNSTKQVALDLTVAHGFDFLPPAKKYKTIDCSKKKYEEKINLLNEIFQSFKVPFEIMIFDGAPHLGDQSLLDMAIGELRVIACVEEGVDIPDNELCFPEIIALASINNSNNKREFVSSLVSSESTLGNEKSTYISVAVTKKDYRGKGMNTFLQLATILYSFHQNGVKIFATHAVSKSAEIVQNKLGMKKPYEFLLSQVNQKSEFSSEEEWIKNLKNKIKNYYFEQIECDEINESDLFEAISNDLENNLVNQDLLDDDDRILLGADSQANFALDISKTYFLEHLKLYFKILVENKITHLNANEKAEIRVKLEFIFSDL